MRALLWGVFISVSSVRLANNCTAMMVCITHPACRLARGHRDEFVLRCAGVCAGRALLQSVEKSRSILYLFGAGWCPFLFSLHQSVVYCLSPAAAKVVERERGRSLV